ncbi:PrgI family protein [Streptodolium elevatio]
MSQSWSGDAADEYMPVRIPADIDREDRVLLGLTARQLLILTVTALLLYGSWLLGRPLIPMLVWAAVAFPVAVIGAALALGQRDGLPLDRLIAAAVRQRLSPRRRVTAPEGVTPVPSWLSRRGVAAPADGGANSVPPAELHLPAEDVRDTGVVDLGADGLAVVAACGTVNFALRTVTEQESLIASFGRYLHSLTASVQVLVRAERVDVSAQIAELREQAQDLPHPALADAAREHADFLAQLGDDNDLLRRQVLLVLREPLHPTRPADGTGGASVFAALRRRRPRRTRRARRGDAVERAAEARLRRRVAEARELLHPVGIAVTALDAGQATAVLASACNPDSVLLPSADIAGAGDIITRPHPEGADTGEEFWAERDAGDWPPPQTDAFSYYPDPDTWEQEPYS